MRHARIVPITLFATICAAVPSAAQDEPTVPVLRDSVTMPEPVAPGFGGDAEYFAPRGALARLHLEPYADLRARYDVVEDRPGATRNLTVTSASVRAGFAWLPQASGVRADLGLRASLSSAQNREAWVLFANERPDTVEWDRASFEWRVPARARVVAGKMRPPLDLSELVWDEDLRPVGGFASLRHESRTLKVEASIAALTRSRFDPSDDARALAGQLVAGTAPAGTAHGGAGVAWLSFDGLEHVARRGLQRQNATIGPPAARTLRHDFDIVIMHAEGRAVAGPVPVAARIDLARNTGATNDRDAVRMRFALGGDAAPQGIELGWVYQRIEREAVPGAFNSDDWWFHSRTQGHLAWLQWGTGRPITARVSGFDERRDDVPERTRRLIVEVRWRPLDP